jgi:hypothetical protein
MKDPKSPQDGTPELKEVLSQSGIKMPEKKGKRKGDQLVGKLDTNVNVGGSSHPNSGSSYNGIFGY